MARTPQAVWIVDTKKEHLAVDEARKLRIPVIGILDTNCDPDEVDFADPGQRRRDPLRLLLTRVVADAVAEGLLSRVRAGAEQTARPRSSRCPTGSASCSVAEERRAPPAAEAPAAEAPAAEAAAEVPAAEATARG